jgi:nucleoside-diphosphate-sugar epimerase
MSLVLLTGARGLLGSTIQNSLRFHPDIEVVTVKHDDFFPNINPDYIIHCAAISKQAYDYKDPLAIFEANILYTQEIIEKYGSSKKPPLFIFPSSIAVYGTNGHLRCHETTECKPTNLYSISKLSTEQMIDFYHKMGKINGLIFRLSALVGKRASGPIFEITKKTLNEEKVELFGFGPTGTTKIYTSVVDVAHLITSILEKPDIVGYRDAAATYNLCSNREFSIKQIYDIVSNSLNIKKESYFNNQTYQGDLDYLRADSNAAKLHFNWRPRNEGIIEYGVECALSLLGQKERTLVGTSEKF